MRAKTLLLTLAFYGLSDRASAQAAAAQPALGVGDAVQGERLYRGRCGGCHALDRDRYGPRHRGVFGRRVASVPGYRYSSALAALSFTWDAATLDRWLEDPGRVAPGTYMTTRTGGSQQRTDIIAYLRALSS